MGSNGVKIIHEAIREKHWGGIGSEAESKIVEEIMGHILGAGADFEDGQNLVDGTHGSPDPGDGLFVRGRRGSEIDRGVWGTEDGAEFIELDHWDG